MKISEPEFTKEDNQIIYSVDVESKKGKEFLWYNLHESFGNLLSSSCDAPLVALLIPAMAVGEDIYIDGMISGRLLYNLSGTFQILLQHIIPSLNQVKIYPKDISGDGSKPAPGVATGFSGGIDSYCVLADHYYSSNTIKGFRVTHLLFNNVGSHGSSEKLFRERYKRLLPQAERLGLHFLMINTNIDFFYDNKLDFQKTHTLRNASVAYLLQRGIGRYMYASSFSYLDTFIGPSNSMGYSDPITLPLLSSPSLDMLSVGSEDTRVEKIIRVAEIPDSYTTLDVCINPYHVGGYTNCSTCEKCLRTLVTLEIAEKLEHYSSSFNLDAYENCRDRFFTKLLASHNPFHREIVQFANERNYSFPISFRNTRLNIFYPILTLLKLIMRKLKNVKNYF